MIEALRQLGATITEVPGDGAFGPDLAMTPISAGCRPGRRTGIDCGLAGTVMRFVPPVAALRRGASLFDGDPHARKRPMGTIIEALTGLGVAVSAPDGGPASSLPFAVEGTGEVRGGHLVIDASASSQFVSALLLAGARFTEGLHLEHRSSEDSGKPVPSLDHINMTVAVLRGVGVAVDDSRPNHWVVSPGPIRAFDQRIEQDLSNAGPFLAAALATRGTVRIPNWPAETTQVGDLWRGILTAMGATVTLTDGTLTVTGGPEIKGADFDETSELAPTVAALCALATRTVTAERHRPPPRARNGPARRPRGRDQPPGRRRRGDQRRPHHPARAAARRRRPQLCRPPHGHGRRHPGPGRAGRRGRGHCHHGQDHAGLPAAVGVHAGPGRHPQRRTRPVARSTDSWDESDVRIRPNKKGTRPRTKDRPSLRRRRHRADHHR